MNAVTPRAHIPALTALLRAVSFASHAYDNHACNLSFSRLCTAEVLQVNIDIKKTWKIYNKVKPQYDSLGLYYENPKSAVTYFCTPKGANIFASMGVGGVHFCTISNHGDKIFVVSPEPCSKRHVFPVANDINEFFMLVVSLYGTQLIDQIPMFSKERFEKTRDEHIKNNGKFISKDIKDFADKFNIVNQELPVYDTVMGLYNSFDYSTIKFTTLYYKTLGIDEE